MGLSSSYMMEEGLGDFQERLAGSRLPEQLKPKSVHWLDGKTPLGSRDSSI